MYSPDDYPEREYPNPMPKLPEYISRIGGTLGWGIFLQMFYHPFDGYVFPDNRPPKSSHWWPTAFAWFLELGIISMNATDTGYNLTAQGRLWVAEEIERQAEIARIKNLQLKRLGCWADFDPDNDQYRDGRNPDDREWMSRVQDTY